MIELLYYNRGWLNHRAIVQLEGLGKLEDLLTSSGLEPATFRFLAYCLNQPRYRVSPIIIIVWSTIHLYL
jgi:hypothetical protein